MMAVFKTPFHNINPYSMHFIPKAFLTVISFLSIASLLSAQGCTLPFEQAGTNLTNNSRTLLSFTSDVDRVIFDIDANRYTRSQASLAVYVNGNLVKGVAIKKGSFDTYFALRNLQGKHIEVKGHKTSATDRRFVRIAAKKQVTWLTKHADVVKQGETTLRIPASGKKAMASFGACNGNAKLNIRVTNNNTANMVVRVREGGSGGSVIKTYTLGGSVKNFTRIINSDKDLYIEFTNTNPNLRKDIRASVRYTTSSGFSLSNN